MKRIALVFASVVLVQLTQAVVVDETQDYSRFRDKLRHVDGNDKGDQPAPQSPPTLAVETNTPEPNTAEQPIEQTQEEGVFSVIGKVAQLNMLMMLKIRIEKPKVSRFERKLPIDYRLAKKFLEYWTNLNGAKLSPDDKFERSAIEFIGNPKNIELAAALATSIKQYKELVAQLIELELQLEEPGPSRKPAEEIIGLAKKVEDSFAKIGDSLDVRTLKQRYNVCKEKHQEFSTMNKFISSW